MTLPKLSFSRIPLATAQRKDCRGQSRSRSPVGGYRVVQVSGDTGWDERAVGQDGEKWTI